MTASIKIIAFPGAPNLPVFAAIEHGFFDKHGVHVSLTTTPSSVYQIHAFHAGEFDLAFTAFDNIVAYQEGQGAAQLEGASDFCVVMGATQVELSAVMSAEIKTAQDIKGKSLALDAVGTGFAFVLYDMLEQLGLHLNDYSRVPVGATPERWQSVKDGQHEPFTSIAKAAGFHVLRQSTESFPVYQGGIVAAKRQWAQQHSVAVQSFIKGYLEGLAWTLEENNSSQAQALLMREMPEIKPGVVAAVMKSLTSPRSGLTPQGAVLPEGMNVVLNLRSKYGRDKTVLNDIDKYLDLSHYHAATA